MLNSTKEMCPKPMLLGHCFNQLSLRAKLAGRVAGDFREGFPKAVGPLHPDCTSHTNSLLGRTKLIACFSGGFRGG